jgi:hypothetical protein
MRIVATLGFYTEMWSWSPYKGTNHGVEDGVDQSSITMAMLVERCSGAGREDVKQWF